jgi:uncharacterized protein (TIGR00369 family)
MERRFSVTWEDPAAVFERGKGMTMIEYLRAIRDGTIPAPPFARLLDMELTRVEPGDVVFEVVPGEQHYNPIGTVHGGLAFALLDSAMSCAVQTMLPAGRISTTLEIKANLVRAVTVKTGRLRALGKIVYVGSRTATSEARLEDAAGKLYAHATTTCLVMDVT